MTLIVLGGTRFLGRHLAALEQQRGQKLTLLHRGRSNAALFPEAEHRVAIGVSTALGNAQVSPEDRASAT